MKRTKNQEVIPSAKRLIGSLRDMGYDFPTAVADLVDNSIEAGATLVTIDVEFDGDDSWVRIADNGAGMSHDELQEAMRYGSERYYEDEDDLGKFGLGLKTASMSQCQRMVVASKGRPRQPVNAYSWDLDHVNATNRWEIIKVPIRELNFILDHHLEKNTGTVVFWQRLDRILGYKHPYGENAKRRMVSMCRELEDHLAMVFHRFLAGEIAWKKLRIVLNGNEVKPWDPFAREESKTRALNLIKIRFEHEGKMGTITLEPFVLPPQDDFSSKDAFTQASGPRKWNRQQGFYIYRANRLIQSGGWSGLKTVDEHLKLARIAVNFSPHLDDAFKINVAKMRVQLPAQIKEQIGVALRPVTKLAQDTYRKNTRKQVSYPLHQPPSHPLSEQRSETSGTVRQTDNHQGEYKAPNQYWTLDDIEEKLKKLAEPHEKRILVLVFERFRNFIGEAIK
jgi:hypothetical protein